MGVDPASDLYPGWSPYNYTLQNPVRYIDPTGMVVEGPPSTDVTKNEDGTYTVVNAHNDGDNNIYVVDGDGNRTGEIIGRSIFDDEFIDPETNDPMEGYTLYPNTPGTTDNNWEHILKPLANQADKLNLKEVALESVPGGLFDIKKDYAGQGRQFKGLGYATSRTAGNFLAGYNARMSSYYGAGISFSSFQKLAGAVHQGVFNSAVAKDILLNGTSYGPAPYYGEIRYQYRASLLGWRAGGFNYLNGAGGRLNRSHLIGID